MKKKLIYVIIVFLVGIISVLAVPFVFRMLQKEKIAFLEYAQMQEMLEADSDFFLIISREGCSDCKALKENLLKEREAKDSIYIFEYEDEQSQALFPELQGVFPEFVSVPYICYVNSDDIEKYEGKLELKNIFEWMDKR